MPFEPFLTDDDYGNLRWYLEEYMELPDGGAVVRAAQIEADLLTWGRQLHDAIFSAGESRAALDRLLAAPEPRELTIATSDPALLRQPWELMADDAGSLSQRVSVRRQLIAPEQLVAREVKLPLRILYIVSRPEDAGFIDPRVTTSVSAARWLDKWECDPGKLEPQCEVGIRNNRFTVVAVSDKALQSDWVQWEIEKHLELNPDADRLLPVKFEELDLPETLEGQLWVDFTDPKQDAENAALLARLIRSADAEDARRRRNFRHRRGTATSTGRSRLSRLMASTVARGSCCCWSGSSAITAASCCMPWAAWARPRWRPRRRIGGRAAGCSATARASSRFGSVIDCRGTCCGRRFVCEIVALRRWAVIASTVLADTNRGWLTTRVVIGYVRNARQCRVKYGWTDGELVCCTVRTSMWSSRRRMICCPCGAITAAASQTRCSLPPVVRS